jgi:hypothetical protein
MQSFSQFCIEPQYIHCTRTHTHTYIVTWSARGLRRYYDVVVWWKSAQVCNFSIVCSVLRVWWWWWHAHSLLSSSSSSMLKKYSSVCWLVLLYFFLVGSAWYGFFFIVNDTLLCSLARGWNPKWFGCCMIYEHFWTWRPVWHTIDCMSERLWYNIICFPNKFTHTHTDSRKPW